MAFTNLTLETYIQEDQDALSFRIWDRSLWNGQSASVTEAYLRLKYYTSDDVLVIFDDYPLIVGAVKTKFNEFLSAEGHIILLSALTVGGLANGLTRFIDGYYMADLVVNDGSYTDPNKPHYLNHQGFLAKARCKCRKVGVKLSWPLSESIRKISYDMLMLRMYIDGAEDAVDLAKYTEYKYIIALVNEIFDFYGIDECF